MNPSPLPQPQTDPTPIFEHYRGSYGTELLTAAVEHLNLFSHLAHAPMSLTALRSALGLAERPATVLLVALRAMGLVAGRWPDQLELTPIAREHLLPGGAFYVGDYVGLSAESPGVLEMVRRLKQNTATPEKTDTGAATTAFTFREGAGESAMDHEASARKLTLALAGRAKNVAPAMAAKLRLSGVKTLLDVGGGTGIYSLALLRANPSLKAIIWDRPEVLKVAREFAEEHQLLDRVELRAGDMFAGEVPQGCDAILLSNILHDWDIPECNVLVRRLAGALPPGGRLLIHDVFLNDTMDGPLPLALYSAALFSVTEGRAYSAAEYGAMLTSAGLTPEPVVPTLVHCGVLAGVKR
ncbi:methyltransferase [Humisphaera borealis]|uniref:Methyltransferase domain-containing protein n=1 Tax=Humisphaera borealis TaxID=2807512 RepID=A0A7M2X2A1_9BACT|nr:methyltransferase [Humisphaera borealis]QOV91825.1 methyltransferase domain-containing protein [Humisphaera borealis]